jgi:hypothetical protein
LVTKNNDNRLVIFKTKISNINSNYTAKRGKY